MMQKHHKRNGKSSKFAREIEEMKMIILTMHGNLKGKNSTYAFMTFSIFCGTISIYSELRTWIP